MCSVQNSLMSLWKGLKIDACSYLIFKKNYHLARLDFYMAQLKIFVGNSFFFFSLSLDQSTLTPVTIPKSPEIPHLNYSIGRMEHHGVAEYVDYCREMTGQGRNPEVRRRGLPAVTTHYPEHPEFWDAGFAFSQIPRPGHGLPEGQKYLEYARRNNTNKSGAAKDRFGANG